MREFFEMECTLCKRRNYSSFKNKKTQTARLELKKFCSTCRKHTPHKERK